MELSITDRMKHAFNAFMNRDPTAYYNRNLGSSYSIRPDRPRLSREMSVQLLLQYSIE